MERINPRDPNEEPKKWLSPGDIRPVYAYGKKIRKLMKAKGLSGAELSRQCGASAGVINRLRRNRTPERWVELHNLRKIAVALGVTVEDLL
jgi:transcriptional regulator with XRE-family HTH domain